MALQPDQILTIAQLTRRVKTLLERDIGAVWVSGEVSNWRVAASGHAYFTLKDETSQIDAVMFAGSLRKLRFEPENGLEVLAHGRITVYEKRGNYQIVLDDLQPKGMGALQLAFERLKKKLEAEGLFDPAHKKPLPMLPQRIGVVTSPTGAAIRDILQVIRRRFANVHILLYPAKVQGEGSAREIAAGIQALDHWGVDVMIVGRGGGSMEDLWAFNEEVVVRAIFAAQTPVISAVGHEIDFTLSDFAADLRAPTPSAAAEIVVREQAVLLETVHQHRRRMQRAIVQHTEGWRRRLDAARKHYLMQRPEELLREARQGVDDARARLESAMTAQITSLRMRADRATHALELASPQQRITRALGRLATARAQLLAHARMVSDRYRPRLTPQAARLHALSPLAILGRGYALAWQLPKHTLVRRATDLKTGDAIEVRLGEGAVKAVVREILPENTCPSERGMETA